MESDGAGKPLVLVTDSVGRIATDTPVAVYLNNCKETVVSWPIMWFWGRHSKESTSLTFPEETGRKEVHVWDTWETFLAGGEAIACAKQRISVRSLLPVYGVYLLFLAYFGDHWNIRYCGFCILFFAREEEFFLGETNLFCLLLNQAWISFEGRLFLFGPFFVISFFRIMCIS